MKFRLLTPDSWRLLISAGASLLILLLLLANIQATLQLHSQQMSWLSLGFSIFLSLLYLALGVIVWLYGIERGVAGLALGFSLSLSATFAVETTASLLDGTLFTTISRVGSGLGFMFLAFLLVVFPHNWVRGASPRRLYLVRLLLAGIGVAGGITVLYALFSTHGGLAHTLYALASYASLLLCSLATMLVSYWRASFRERQQFLLVFLGIGLAVTPFTILTVLPTIFHLSAYSIESQISSIPFVLMPLSISYSILRYQLIIFDRVIRIAVSRITGVVVIALIAYLVVLSVELFVTAQQEIIAAMIAAILTPLAWRGTHVAIEHLFFREEIRYRTLVGERALRVLRLSEVCNLLLWKARETLGTSFVCLFVYDSTRDEYVIPLSVLEQSSNLPYLTEVVAQLQKSLNGAADPSTFSLPRVHQLVSALATSTRPLSVRDALVRGTAPSWKTFLLRGAEPSLHLAAVPHPHDPNAGPIPGFLAFGGPSLPKGFAGPELEAVMLLVQHWSSALDAALLHEREKHRAQVQAALYLATMYPPRATAEEVIENCLHALAQATGASVAFWHYQEGSFTRTKSVGGHVWEEHHLRSGQHPPTGSAWFSTADESTARPSSFPYTDGWLPLTAGEYLFGAVTLRFPSKYLCDQKEQQVLHDYVSRCAQILFSSQEAAARHQLHQQAEQLQILKDQFLIRASRQLLTPLTVARGYIELLRAGESAQRAEYLDKALAASMKLGDLIETLLRLSTLSLDEEGFSLEPVVLYQCLQMAEMSIGKEEHSMAIDADLCVAADEQSLVMALILLLTAAREEHCTPIIESHARRRGGTIELLVEVRGEPEASSPSGDETTLAACACLIEAMGGSFQRTTKTPTYSSFTLALAATTPPSQKDSVYALQK